MVFRAMRLIIWSVLLASAVSACAPRDAKGADTRQVAMTGARDSVKEGFIEVSGLRVTDYHAGEGEERDHLGSRDQHRALPSRRGQHDRADA
jgi:hypothetical protein